MLVLLVCLLHALLSDSLPFCLSAREVCGPVPYLLAFLLLFCSAAALLREVGWPGFDMSVATLLPLSQLDLSPPQVPHGYLWSGGLRLPWWPSYERHQGRHQALCINILANEGFSLPGELVIRSLVMAGPKIQNVQHRFCV